jgi:hypothetical protein
MPTAAICMGYLDIRLAAEQPIIQRLQSSDKGCSSMLSTTMCRKTEYRDDVSCQEHFAPASFVQAHVLVTELPHARLLEADLIRRDFENRYTISRDL